MLPNYLYKIIFMTLITVTSMQGASTFTFNQALDAFHKQKLKLPKQDKDGRSETLNNKGAAAPKFDDATLAFLDFGEGKKVLEIGGAYGNVMLEAMHRNPKTTYHLNDLDSRHLSIAAYRLQSKLDQKKIKLDGVQHIQFIYGDITQPKWKPNEEYDAILIARVLHFLNPEQMDRALSNIYRSLKPGGRVFIITITPYVNRYKAFIPEFEKRLKAGQKYPGYIKSLHPYANPEVTSEEQLQNIMAEEFMFLNDKVLRRIFRKHGFSVLEARHTPLRYTSKTWQLDGRENVILIAEKPKRKP